MPRTVHIALEQEDFLGLYSRGISDTVPDKYFLDCLNVKYGESEVNTREGLSLSLTKSNIVRYFTYERLNETPRKIILDNVGHLFDSLAPGVPIWTDAAIVDFSMLNFNNRAYITVHNRKNGIAAKYLLVYEGSGTARLAAGVAPSGFTLGAVTSASAGSVEAGIHLIAVCFLTSSGYITAPGPAVFKQYLAPGGFKIDTSSLPIGGAGTSGRIILATKAIPVSLFTGNQEGYEFFFVPNGIINDNASTTKTIDFFDSDLQDSADYLLDNLSNIPAGVAIFTYKGRIGICAPNGQDHTILMSNANDPETFSGVDGFITCDPSAAVSGIRTAFEFRSNLVIVKKNRIYSTSDNGSSPNSWTVGQVDNSAGTECFGIGSILDARGSNSDRVFMADLSGLVSYEGYIRRPELSFNIEDVWKRINKAHFDLVQVVDDPVKHRLLVSVPLDAATAISHVLYADYSKAFTVYGTLNERLIKWAIWSFTTAPVCITGDVDSVTFDSILTFGLSGGNIYEMKAANTSDDGTAIDSYITTCLKSAMSNWINHFAGIKLRVTGTGNLQITLYSQDAINSQSVTALALSTSPGLEPDRLINYLAEKMSVKLRVNQFNEKFTISKITIYAKELYLRRVG